MIHFMSPEDADKHRQEHEVASHDVNRLFSELPEDQLRALDFLLISIANANSPGRIAAYMCGRSTATLQSRFGICAACNVNHDTELLAPSPVVDDTSEVPMPPHVAVRRQMSENEIAFTPIGSKEPITPEEALLMEEYSLDDARDGETNALMWFICTRCEMQYQTIQDRMLRDPGETGCNGCIQKTKWG